MDPVFAPWRMEWVTRENTNEEFDSCIFCALPEQEADRKHRILARSQSSYVLMNRAPYTPGHLLVVPKSHENGIEHVPESVLSDTFKLVQTSIQAINRALYPDGFNVGMNIGKAGGASIEDHLHVHVVPRWEGDTTFMPTTANSKIIAEALEETYERLYEAFLQVDGVKAADEDSAVMVN